MTPSVLDESTRPTPPLSVSWVDPVIGSTVQAETTGPIPEELLDRYVRVAVRRAALEKVDAGSYYAELPGFPGVWAEGQSPAECLDSLADVLRDWLFLKIADRDRDLPVVDEIDLRLTFRI